MWGGQAASLYLSKLVFHVECEIQRRHDEQVQQVQADHAEMLFEPLTSAVIPALRGGRGICYDSACDIESQDAAH